MADDLQARAQTSDTAIYTSPTPRQRTASRDNVLEDCACRQVPGLDTDINGHDDLQDILSPIAVHADAEPTAQGEFESHASTPAIDVPPASGQHGAGPVSDNGSYLESRYVEESPLEEFMRNRRPSISFDPKIRLEAGHQQALETPLPKLAINTRIRRESILRELCKPTQRSPLSRTYSEADSGAFDSVTGEPTRSLAKQNHSVIRTRPPQNRSRYPLLHSTVNTLPSEKEQVELETGSSLTSESTASTILSEVRTPTDETMDYLVSPISTYSPFHIPVSLEESSAWPKPYRQPSSSRANSYTFDRKISVRSANRSRRSTSSVSPATAFLSKFTPREPAPPEPDSEGQEVGDYVLGRQVGFGGFSVVREAYTFEGGDRVLRAVKIVRRVVSGKTEQENEQFQTEFEREVALWRCLGHRHILPLIAVYITPFATFCFTKLNSSGTLFDLVRSNRNGLRQDLARRYAYQLASAIRYLHEDMRVVHRDIKLENCLLDLSAADADSEGGNLLLCDFGLAEFITRTPRRSTPTPSADSTPYGTPPMHDSIPAHHGMRHYIGPSETSTSIAGSLQYAAPELIMSPAGLLSTAVDIWAFGVVIYALMVGDLPFQHIFQPRVQMMILAGEWDLGALRGAEGVVKEGREDEVEEVVAGCLDMRSEERWTVGRVLGCAWLEGCQEVVEEAGGWKL